MRRAIIPWGWGSNRSPTDLRAAAASRPRPALAPTAPDLAVSVSAAERVALGGVMLLAALLTIFLLDREGIPNAYYAATIKSMLTSWHAFFFASFDPAGFVSVDKPPLGFWIQAASARLLGFSGISLLLPEAIASVLSVALLYLLVRRPFGPAAALLAALTLAVTPIAVAVARNNTIDALLILTLLGAVWALFRAIEHASLGWLLASMAVAGLGFNIKMLQAYLIVPALFLAYLVGTNLPWRTRIKHLALAGLVLLAVSFSWATVVELTPASERPYVGSSQNNSVLNLVVGYNGLTRLLPRDMMSGMGSGGPTDSGRPRRPDGGREAGEPGPLRLFNVQLAGQIAWLLPLAGIGLAAAWWQTRTRVPLARRQTALVMWGTWLVTAVGYFSVSSMFHRYYLVMLGPPIAALVGAGLVALWRDYRRPGWRGWLLPATILLTTLVQVRILAAYPEWSARLAPFIAIGGITAVIMLVLFRLRIPWLPRRSGPCLPLVATLGLLAILTSPAVWSGITTSTASGPTLPAAGPPDDFGMPGAAAGQGANSPGTAGAGPGMGEADPKLVAYLLAQRGEARFLAATTNAMSASPLILATGQPVAALGGFIGMDPILTVDDLAGKVASGEMRFFLMPTAEQSAEMAAMMGTTFADGGNDSTAPAGQDSAPAMPGPFGGAATENVQWVTAHCSAVPETLWRSADAGAATPFGGMDTLFDCAGAA